MLSNIEARALATADLEAALKAAGLGSGSEMTPDEIRTTERTLFWRGVAGVSQSLYVLYDVIDSAEQICADNQTIGRYVLAVLRVWSKASFDSAPLQQTLAAIENALTEAEWNVSFDSEYFAEDWYNQPITAGKTIMKMEE